MLRKKLAVVGLTALLIITFSATAMALDLSGVSNKINYKISSLSGSIGSKLGGSLSSLSGLSGKLGGSLSGLSSLSGKLGGSLSSLGSTLGKGLSYMPKISVGTIASGTSPISKKSNSKTTVTIKTPSFASKLSTGSTKIGNSNGTSSLYKSFSAPKTTIPKTTIPKTTTPKTTTPKTSSG